MKEGKEKKKKKGITSFVVSHICILDLRYVCVCRGGGGYAALRVTALEMMSFIDEQRG